MIKSAKFKNFVSHKDSYLEFHSGLNIIAGATGNGKSVLHNGFEWVFLNNTCDGYRPTTYPVNKKDASSVEVELDDGKICRERNAVAGENGVNDYLWEQSEKSGKCEALRRNVPDEIFNISRIDEVNIQGQEDDRFLISKHTSPGEVAKKLNEFVGLTVIDDVLDKAKSNVDGITKEINLTKKSLEVSEEKVANLAYLSDLEPIFAEMDSLLVRQEEIKNKISKVKELSTSILNLRQRINDNREWLESKSFLEEIESLSNKRGNINFKLQQIMQLIESMGSNHKKIKKAKEFLKAKDTLSELETLIEKQRDIVSLIKKIKSVSNLTSVFRQQIHNNKEKAFNIQSQLDELLRSVKLCPIFEVFCPLQKGG